MFIKRVPQIKQSDWFTAIVYFAYTMAIYNSCIPLPLATLPLTLAELLPHKRKCCINGLALQYPECIAVTQNALRLLFTTRDRRQRYSIVWLQDMKISRHLTLTSTSGVPYLWTSGLSSAYRTRSLQKRLYKDHQACVALTLTATVLVLCREPFKFELFIPFILPYLVTVL